MMPFIQFLFITDTDISAKIAHTYNVAQFCIKIHLQNMQLKF